MGKWSETYIIFELCALNQTSASGQEKKASRYYALCFVLFMWCTAKAFEIRNPSKIIKVRHTTNIFLHKMSLVLSSHFLCSMCESLQTINSFNRSYLLCIILHRKHVFLCYITEDSPCEYTVNASIKQYFRLLGKNA